MTSVKEHQDRSVKRHKSQTTPQFTTSVPSYESRAPNSLLFYTKGGSPALLPYLVAVIGTRPNDRVELPSMAKNCTGMEELLTANYPGFSHPSTATSEYLTERTILSVCNDISNTINLVALDDFPGEARIYLGADSIAEDYTSDPMNINQLPSNYLNSLEPSGLPPFALKLKVVCPIIDLYNISPKDGVCNETRMKVVGVSDHVINVIVFTGDKAGEPVFIPRISLTPSPSNIPVPFTR